MELNNLTQENVFFLSNLVFYYLLFKLILYILYINMNVIYVEINHRNRFIWILIHMKVKLYMKYN